MDYQTDQTQKGRLENPLLVPEAELTAGSTQPFTLPNQENLRSATFPFVICCLLQLPCYNTAMQVHPAPGHGARLCAS